MKRLIPLVCLLALAACGSGGGAPPPTTPSPTPPPAPPVPPPANRSPSITALPFTPGFGIASLTRFDYSASATDPDGDALTYTWDIAGVAASGASGRLTFAPPGGSGTWRGTWGVRVFTSNLTQNGTALTGDYSDQLGPGRLDPAVANTIDANGNVKLRYKQSIFSDFTFTGRIGSTGRTITGVVNGSGAVNVPFTMSK